MEKEQQIWPVGRSKTDKNKDITIAKLEHEVQKHKQSQRNIKKIFIFVLIHIFVISICVSVAVVYQYAMVERIKRPQNCLYFTLDLKYDFIAFCELCEPGYQKLQGQNKCIQSQGS